MMAIHDNLIFAKSRLEGLSSGFRGSNTQMDFSQVIWGLLIVAGLTFVIWLLSRLFNSQGRGQHGPLRLFWELCQAHHVTWSERWLLWRVSRSQHLSDPARLFLEPERFDPANLGKMKTQIAKLKSIRSKLFAGLPDRPSKTVTPPASRTNTATPSRSSTNEIVMPTLSADSHLGSTSPLFPAPDTPTLD